MSDCGCGTSRKEQQRRKSRPAVITDINEAGNRPGQQQKKAATFAGFQWWQILLIAGAIISAAKFSQGQK